MAEVLGTSRLPDDFFDADGSSLLMELLKGGGVKAFLGRLTAEAAPFPGLSGISLLGVDQDGGSHILHSFFSVPVGPYDLDRQLFGCRGELPSEGIPAITEIPVVSFAARRGVSTVPREDHNVHLEGVSPSSWRTTPCKRANYKSEGRNLACWGLTFLPPDVAAPLLQL